MPKSRVTPGEVDFIELDIGWSKISMYIISLGSPVDPDAVASLDKQFRDCIIIGVTKDVTPCRIALALLYTQEDLQVKRPRIKNPTLLLLMNIYGFRQIKDLLDNIKQVDKIALINCEPHAITSILSRLERLANVKLVSNMRHASPLNQKCEGRELYLSTSNRLKAILK